MMQRSAIAAILVCVCVFGCGKKLPEMGQVTGSVRVKGRPQPNLLVRFLPDPEKGNSSPINASGKTDAQGKYSLQHVYQDEAAPGAPVGWHRVMIEDTSRVPTPQGQTPPPPLIPLEYGSPASTPLRMEVKSGTQTIDLDVGKK
jgi:hypothetical protein